MFGPLHHSSPGSETPVAVRVRDFLAGDRVDELALHVRDGRADGVEGGLVVVERDRVADRAHLGHAVTLPDLAAEPPCDGAAEFPVERGGPPEKIVCTLDRS